MKDKKQGDESKIKIALEYSNNIIATLRESFLVLDKDLRVISANQAFYTIFEVAEKDTIGRSLLDLGNKQWNIPKLLQLLKEIIPEKKVVKDYEVEHKFEQIGERVMVLNARQLRVPKKIAEIIATRIEEEEELILLAIEDITERKRLEGELKESEERFRRAFETSRDGLLLVHKTEGAILNSNASAQELLGYSSDEFLKKKLWEIGMVKDNGEFQELALKLEKDGVVPYQDSPVKTKEGMAIRADVFLVDRAKVIQCNIRNITERKQTEDALRESQECYQALVENTILGITEIDTNYKIIMANTMIAKLFNKPASDFVGKNCFREYEKREAVCPYCPGKRAMASGKTMEAETQGVRDDGSRFYVRNRAIPFFGPDGVVKGFIEMIEDIDARKKLEEENSKHMQELEVFYKASVGREERILELKKETEELKNKLAKYEK